MTQNPDTIHETVREHYAERIKNSASCCGRFDTFSATPDSGHSTDSNLYPADLLATIPEGESVVSYGCGEKNGIKFHIDNLRFVLY